MSHPNNGFAKRRKIMNALGIKDVPAYKQYIRKLYEKEMMSGIEIAEFIKKVTGEELSPRSIQRIVEREGGKMRTMKEAFNLAIKKGRVDWAYRSDKIRRKRMSNKLRFEVLVRDNFRCQLCGRDKDDAVLEVDHIVPVSEGGAEKEENLRTLCHECNKGKSEYYREGR